MKAHILCSITFSRKSCNIMEDENIIWRMLFASWITKATDTHSCCATNRKVTGSIPAGVSGFFIDIKSFQSHYGPGVDSASNRNEYQEYFLAVKAAGA